MLVDHIRDFVGGRCSVSVHLLDGTQLLFSTVEVCKIGGPPPFKRDPVRVAALVASLPDEGGPPILFVELRRPTGRVSLDAFGRHFATMEERERVHALMVDSTAHWRLDRGSVESSSRSPRAPGDAVQPDLFGAVA